MLPNDGRRTICKTMLMPHNKIIVHTVKYELTYPVTASFLKSPPNMK